MGSRKDDTEHITCEEEKAEVVQGVCVSLGSFLCTNCLGKPSLILEYLLIWVFLEVNLEPKIHVPWSTYDGNSGSTGR